MFLRELDGRYAGEVREFPAEVGQALLSAGRAVNPWAEDQRVTVPAVVATEASPKPPVSGARKAGRK